MSDLAARLREAFLGTETGEAVPFDELKDTVRDRWQRVADAAREVPPEGIALAAARERGHRAALRVPFSDAQIERMAKACAAEWNEEVKWYDECDPAVKANWCGCIRAALAAGGLEPCAVPEYDPADVALTPSGDEVEKLARVLCRWDAHDAPHEDSWTTTLLLDQNAYRHMARAAIAHLRPTQGHVLRDRLVEAEAKIERQRAALAELNDKRTLWAGERAALKQDITNAVRNAMDRLPDAPWKDKTATEAVWLLSLAVGNLRAEVDEDNTAAASVNDLLVQVQNLTAERDALRERAGVPSVDPPNDQVEALARVLHEAEPSMPPATYKERNEALARAAIAHLSNRPEGLPTMRYLREIGVHAYLSHDSAKRENAGCMVDPMGAAADAVLDALRPWLRDPVGWEMDVHPDQLELYKWVTEPDGGYAYAAQQALDLCRKRIRPVYECKECAKWEARYKEMKRWHYRLDGMIEAARAALEGE